MKSRILLLILIIALTVSLNAQTDSIQTYVFSLSEAQNYALENNYDIKNKQLDIEIAQKQVWQTTAIGLPQFSFSASWQYIFDVPVMTMGGMGLDSVTPFLPYYNIPDNPASGLNYMLPNYQYYENELELGTKSNVTFNFTLSQIIFSGEYIVGLQAAKVFKALSLQSLDKAERDMKETIAQSYYLVLVMKQSVDILDSSYTNMQKIATEMEAMYKSGYIEETDVAQILLTSSTIQNQLNSMKRIYEVSERLLKFQLAINFSDTLILSDDLFKILQEANLENYVIGEFSVQSNIDYQLMQTSENLAALSLKREQSKYLPSIAAYYRHQEQLDAPEFNFNPPDVIGASLEWNLFSSGLRNATIQQKKIELAKIQNSKEQVEMALNLEYQEALNTFITAQETYLSQNKNFELAQKIYKNTLIKYKAGMSSSLDITQTQNQYLEIQSTYFQALVELLNAKATLDKLLN